MKQTYLKRGITTLLFISVMMVACGIVTAEQLITVTPETITLGEDGNSTRIDLRIKVSEEWHINAHKPLQDFLIPTEVTVEVPPGFTVEKINYPEPQKISFSFFDEPVLVYGGSFLITVLLKGNVETEHVFSGSVTYQGCNDRTCVQPDSASFSVTLTPRKGTDTSSGTPIPSPSTGEPAIAGGDESPPMDVQAPVGTVELTSDEKTAMSYMEKGFLYALLMFFLAGLSLNLTPCVYPVIPITVSFFGAQGEQQRGSKFLIALVYTIGIAVIFALLGLLSSLAGKQWGFLFQNAWFTVVISLVMLAMAASMFGVFEIRIPMSLMSRLGQSREGLIGALVMGMTVGIVIAPCAAGIIIGLVGLVAKLGLVVKGTVYFFVMGLGLGVPYLFLATFSGLLGKIPTSGMWMIWIKKVFGIILVGVAIYFILPQAMRMADQRSFYFGILSLFGGLYLGFLDHSLGYTRLFNIIRAAVGIALVIAGFFLLNSAIASGPADNSMEDSPITWLQYNGQSDKKLLAAGKPVIIDFYADWCAPCRAMDSTTFRDPSVVSAAQNFTMVRVDGTRLTGKIQAFMKRHGVIGMPTVIFMSADGSENKKLRSGEYLAAEDMLKRMTDHASIQNMQD